MKTLRAIVVLLVSFALPFSAMATMLENLHCHHDGLGALLDPPLAVHVHPCAHHPGMMVPDQLNGVAQASHAGCDCAVKCHCQHDCTSGGALAAALAPPGLPLYARVLSLTPTTVASISDAQLQRLLRPPIAALPGAA